MKEEILNELRKITSEEEQAKSNQVVDKSLYHMGEEDEYDASLLLEQGKLISIRKHTRFVHFPKHTHNYVEVIYMCAGETHHVINGADVYLREGELLFLNQNSVQEIYPAGEDDIGVNFIILPEFFDYALRMFGEEKNPLRSFVIACMMGANEKTSYLHFKVADIIQIQNLVENLIWTLMNRQPNRRSINQITMGLLLLNLMNHMDAVETDNEEEGQRVTLAVLNYIEEHYKEGSLMELAGMMHYDFYWLSKEIKRQTGQTYTDLVQVKRLSQAAYLLTHTTVSVSEVAVMVGYENISYFHRIFRARFGCSPGRYRKAER